MTNPTIVTNAAEWLHRYRSVPERARLLSARRGARRADRRRAAEPASIFFGGGGENGFLEPAGAPGRTGGGASAAQLYDRLRAHLLDARREERRVDVRRVDGRASRSRRARGWREERAETQSTLDPRTVTDDAAGGCRARARGGARPARAAPDRRGGDARHAVARADRRHPLRRVARVRAGTARSSRAKAATARSSTAASPRSRS